jgi:demethylmenaquinone methyltransferase / 2-methoxy-6-polyprenyl-1,4-benzoquinol methylase
MLQPDHMSAVEQSRAEPNRFAQGLFRGLPGRYDVLEDVLSLRQNNRWRTRMVDAAVADRPSRVLDVATGTAGVALMLVDRSDAEVVGIDLTEAMLQEGRRRVAERGRDERITLTAGRAEDLPFEDDSFDALTFTYLLRYVADPAGTLAELARVVRPGGVVASLEFGVPSSLFWRTAWRLYTRLVLPSAGFVAGGKAWARVGWFLGPSIEQHYRRYPVATHVAMWQAAGLEQVRAQPMSLGGGLVMSGRKRHG